MQILNWNKYWRFWPLYVMLLPTTVILIINNYIPMFGLLVAFKNVNYTDGILGSPWNGIENFKFLFSTNDAWIITRNTLLYNFVFIAMNIIVAVLFAVLLNELRGRYLPKIYQSTMFFPFFLSMVVVSYLVYAFLNNENGFMNNTFLPWLGLDTISWYSEPKYWPFILPLINLWKNIGYYTVYFVAAMVTFNSEYYEAAVIDGASKWQQAIRITLPQLMPLIVVLTLLQIGRIFYADFGLFYQVPLNAGAIFDTTNVIDTYVYRTFLTMGDVGMSSAAAFYQSFVGFILVFLSNYIVRKTNKENALF
ncbi:ABC transporter permease [Paenibacillus sp. GCM10023252]|uniref:ABC transporter permease n=1 Tax=Paenibacillus sp. GCM10023252 TaxID=3252649 RepID=UPI00360890CB